MLSKIISGVITFQLGDLQESDFIKNSQNQRSTFKHVLTFNLQCTELKSFLR